MGDAASVLNQLSNALESRARDAGSVVVAIRNSSHQHVTGVLWAARCRDYFRAGPR